MPASKVASIADLPDGKGTVIVVNGKEIALFNKGGKFFAIANECPHRGGPLGEGFLSGNVVSCPWHGWQFDVESGNCVTMNGAKLATYKVEVKGTDVFVDV